MAGGYEQFLETADQTDVLGRISVLADKCKDLKAQIDVKAAELKSLVQQRDRIQECELPELFESVGIGEVKTKSGIPLKLVEQIHHSVSKDRKAAAMKWLEDNGHGGLIKNTIVVAFNKGDDEKVADLLETLSAEFENVRTDKEVAPASLGALLRRLLAEGQEVPHDTFGIHPEKIVEVK